MSDDHTERSDPQPVPTPDRQPHGAVDLPDRGDHLIRMVGYLIGLGVATGIGTVLFIRAPEVIVIMYLILPFVYLYVWVYFLEQYVDDALRRNIDSLQGDTQ